MAVVLNTGLEPRTTRAVLQVDGQPLADRSVTARPGSTTVRFSAPLPPAGAASVTIDDPTGYVFDNVRYLLLDPPPAARLLLVTNDGGLERSAFFLERALLVAEEVSPLELKAARPTSLSEVPPEALQSNAAILLLGTEGLDRRGKETMAAFVRAGGGLLIVTGPTFDPALASGLFGDEPAVSFVTTEPQEERVRSFEPSDLRHPIFRAFGDLTGSLGQVRFRRTLRVAETPGARVLARFHDGTPALVEYAAGEGRALLLASDLNNEWNDFPRRPTFVPFVHETLRYLMGSRERSREFLIGSMPASLPRQPGIVRASAGSARPEPGRRMTSAQDSLVGGRREEDGGRVSINVDPRESDPGRLSADEFRASVSVVRADVSTAVEDDAIRRESSQSLWWYAIAALVAVLIGESLLARRVA
jgi:hypothetical protein